MKKYVVLLFVSLCLLMTGCSNKFAEQEYDSIDKIIQKEDRYAKEYSAFSPIDGGYSLTVSKFNGRETLWSDIIEEEKAVELDFSFSLSEGRAKVVHIDAEGNVTTVIECSPENSTDGFVTKTISLKSGENRLKFVGYDCIDVDLKMLEKVQKTLGQTNESSKNIEPVVTPEPLKTPEPPKVSSIDFTNIDVCFNETAETALPVTLTVVSENDNKISQIKDWFVENELFLPMLSFEWEDMLTPAEDAPTINWELFFYGTAFYDDNYIYDWTSSELNIYDRNSNQLLHTISYQMDQWYLMGNCAYLRDGILYIGCLYNGYAMPDTCYILAYDIENEKVLWRSEDQTYNTMNFIVKDDVIICGYGFTAEKDYIYQLDMNTGKVISKTELKKMPELLVEKDGQLYVHTYSYDYILDMK